MRDMAYMLLAAGLGVAFVGGAFWCCGTNLPPPAPPTPVSGADGSQVDPCAAGCANLQKLDCAEALGDAGFSQCVAGCKAAVSGEIAAWAIDYAGPKCWAAAPTQAAVRNCPGILSKGCP